MLGLFKKKKDAEVNEEIPEESSDSEPAKAEKIPQTISANSNNDIIRLSTEIDRLKASVESFGEVRKGFSERITNINEQIGELRAMIMDRDRTIQELELKAVKAADLVESVQPEKLMIEMQKEDAKFEALKANLEGNEAIMNRIMDELRDMRKKLDFFRGVDEVVKLSQEVRKELIEIKKVEALIHIDTDKVETIYSELRKKFQEIDLFSDNLRELKVNLDQNAKDIDFVKTKILNLAEKNELEKLGQKVQRYIDALNEINKTSSLSKDISQLKTMLEGLK